MPLHQRRRDCPRGRHQRACLPRRRLSNGSRGQSTVRGEVAEAGVSEAQIAVHWREEEYYPPPAAFIAQANASDPAILERFAEEHFPECFKEYAEMLTWDVSGTRSLDTSNPPFWKWWVGGRLNACVNCVDRHLESRGEQERD